MHHRGVIAAAAHIARVHHAVAAHASAHHVHTRVMLATGLHAPCRHHLAVRKSHHLGTLLLRVHGERGHLVTLNHAAVEARTLLHHLAGHAHDALRRHLVLVGLATTPLPATIIITSALR